MTVIAAKWTVEDYHQMIEKGILRETPEESLRERLR
jgi:hypothetical protein